MIVLTQNISTKDSAKIFLNINTEQKPVPQSLVYDLFGEIKNRQSVVVRATDIANRLNEDFDSPYYQCVKKPGAAQGIGKIELSTIVNSTKDYIKNDGIFDQLHVEDFELQYLVICNFFSVLKKAYQKDGSWLTSKNPFMTNAGFYAGVKFLCDDLILKCAEKSSFEQSTMSILMNIEDDNLLFKEDIKNLQGKEQRNEIYKYLKKAMMSGLPKQNEYKF